MAHTDLTGENYIAGNWVSGGGDVFSSYSPATGERIWTGYETDEAGINAAVEAARDAFSRWSKLTLEDRLEYIERFAALAAEQKEDLAQLISKETGKALWDARTEAGAVSGKAPISLKAYHERTGSKETDLGAMTLRVSHRPHGVMAVLGPFNFPAHLPNGHIIPALIAGNTVVLKPSEQSPAVAEMMVRLWEQAELPGGVVNLVQGAREPAQHLVSHDDINGVLFTGGVPAGTAIHRALAGQPQKILALELGGNNPLVVWDAADVKSAARIAVKSAFISAGQRCTCARRLILKSGPEGDAVVEALGAMMDALSVGLPDAEDQPFYGSLINSDAVDNVLEAQNTLAEAGGEIFRAAARTNDGGAFMRPGLMDVTAVENRPDEEIFGPFLQIIRVDSFKDAIAEANNTRFGLAAGLVSDDAEKFETFARDVHAGILNWNRQTTGASGAAPFGGPGLSGNHRPAGYYAADYSAWPMANLIAAGDAKDEEILPGMPE